MNELGLVEEHPRLRFVLCDLQPGINDGALCEGEKKNRLESRGGRREDRAEKGGRTLSLKKWKA